MSKILIDKNSNPLQNRIIKNYKKLKGTNLIKQTNCFRLYDRDMPEYPYIIDYYAGHFLVYEKGLAEVDDALREKNLNLLNQAIEQTNQIIQPNIPVSITFKVKERKEGGTVGAELNEQKSTQLPSQPIIASEYDRQYQVDLRTYMDCGLFLDHRPLRKKIADNKELRTFLNLFAYTCSVSVSAAKAGAKTVSVDKSSKYLDWGKNNFKLNNIDIQQHHFIADDATNYLEQQHLQSNRERFDMIFCDPPSFSNEKKKSLVFDVLKDHPRLVKLCMNCLQKDGILYFSNNLRKFKLSDEIESIYSVKNITSESIPLDFHDQKIHHCFEIRHKK